MTVRNYAMALNAHRSMLVNQTLAAKSLNRVSSGYRINSAADDAAGLAISEGMRGQIRGLGMASQNAQNSISLLQTAEGGLGQTQEVLHRMRELAVRVADGTMSDSDRELANKEFQEIKAEIDRVSGSSHYNQINLLDGTAGGVKGSRSLEQVGIGSIDADGFQGDFGLTVRVDQDGLGSVYLRQGDRVYEAEVAAGSQSANFQLENGGWVTVNFEDGGLRSGVVKGVEFDGRNVEVRGAVGAKEGSQLYAQVGANAGEDQRIAMKLGNVSTESLGIYDLDILTKDGANAAVKALDNAINDVIGQRTAIGAQVNRLEHSINNIETSRINTIDSESTIRDADIALEMMNYVKHNFQSQLSQYVIGQMSQSSSYFLQLLYT